MELVRIASRENIGKLVEENIHGFREKSVGNHVELAQRFVALRA